MASYEICPICGNKFNYIGPLSQAGKTPCVTCLRQQFSASAKRTMFKGNPYQPSQQQQQSQQPPDAYFICPTCDHYEIIPNYQGSVCVCPYCGGSNPYAGTRAQVRLYQVTLAQYNIRVSIVQAKAKKAAQAKQQMHNAYARTASYTQTVGGQQQNVSSSQTKCRIWYDLDLQAYQCSTPYSKEFVEFIKITIPVSDRAYDPTTKIWAFGEKYLDVISETAKKVWKGPGEVVIITKQQTEAQNQSKTSSAPALQKQTTEQVLVEFVKLLPVDALIAAYRRACMDLHPDRQGGDGTKMATLNMLYDRIKADKGIK